MQDRPYNSSLSQGLRDLWELTKPGITALVLVTTAVGFYLGSEGAIDLEAVRSESLKVGYSAEARGVLGKAARTRKAGWFKSVTWMEDTARDIVGPDLGGADAGFRALIDDIFAWAKDAE